MRPVLGGLRGDEENAPGKRKTRVKKSKDLDKGKGSEAPTEDSTAN